jgi:hypothetical protein
VSSDRSAGPIRDNVELVRRALAEAAVWSVGVVVLDVLVEELFELPTVPDEGAVAEFASCGANPSFRVRVRDRRVRRGTNDGGSVAAEDLIERAEELAGAVADQVPDRPVGTQLEVPYGLCGPVAGRIRGYASQVHAASVEFDEEQDVVATQQDGIYVKKSHAIIPAAWLRENVVHDSEFRPGAGSKPAFLRIAQIVDAAIVMPTWASSLWMRR